MPWWGRSINASCDLVLPACTTKSCPMQLHDVVPTSNMDVPQLFIPYNSSPHTYTELWVLPLLLGDTY